MSYHLKYLKYKKKYLNLKAELEGGSGIEEVAECLFNQEMTVENFMDILGDIDKCNDEQIKDQSGLEMTIENYFNFIKENREYVDIDDRIKETIKNIAEGLAYRRFGGTALISRASSLTGVDSLFNTNSIYNNIIKPRIDFLKLYNRYASIDSNIRKITELESEVGELGKQVREQEEHFQVINEERAADIVRLTNQMDEKKMEIQRFQAEITEKERELKRLQLETGEQTGRIDQLQTRVTQQASQIREKDRKLEQQASQIREKDSELEEKNKRIEELDQRISEVTERINRVKKALEVLDNKYIEMNKGKELLKKQLEQHKEEIIQKNEIIQQLREDVAASKQLNTSLIRDLNKLADERKKLESNNLELQQLNLMLRRDFDNLSEYNDNLEKELSEAKDANMRLIDVIIKLSKAIVDLDRIATEKDKKIADLDKRIAKLATEYAIAKKSADMEIKDLINEKNKEVKDLKDQIISKDNTILKIRTKVNKNLSKLIQNMIDTIEPKTYKQPPLFMI